MDADEWWPAEAFPKIGDNGFLGVTIPEEYGGVGIDLFGRRPGAAGLRRAGTMRWRWPGWRMTISAPTTSFATATRRSGSKYLPGLCSGREDRRARPDRTGRRLGCARLDAHHRAARRRPLRAQRQQDLHHQRPGRRRAAGLRQDRQGTGAHGISAFIVEKDFPGFQRGAEAREDGLSRQPDRRAGVRGLPRAGREPASARKTAASPW